MVNGSKLRAESETQLLAASLLLDMSLVNEVIL